jgi:hypothetical protein
VGFEGSAFENEDLAFRVLYSGRSNPSYSLLETGKSIHGFQHIINHIISENKENNSKTKEHSAYSSL